MMLRCKETRWVLREGRVARTRALHHGRSRLPQNGRDDRFTFRAAWICVTSHHHLGFPRYVVPSSRQIPHLSILHSKRMSPWALAMPSRSRFVCHTSTSCTLLCTLLTQDQGGQTHHCMHEDQGHEPITRGRHVHHYSTPRFTLFLVRRLDNKMRKARELNDEGGVVDRACLRLFPSASALHTFQCLRTQNKQL